MRSFSGLSFFVYKMGMMSMQPPVGIAETAW